MSLFSVLKQNSRLALRQNWGKAICLLLLTMGATGLLQVMQGVVMRVFVDTEALDPTLAIQYGFNAYFLQQFAQASLIELLIIVAFSLLGMLILAPIRLGGNRWYYELVQGKAPALSEVFRYFESGRQYLRALLLDLHLGVRSLLWAFVFYLLPGCVTGVSIYFAAQGEALGSNTQAAATVGLLIALALTLLAAIFYGAVMSKYMLAAYLMSEDETLSVRAAIRQSAAYTKGYRFSLFGYQMTFFGWFLLAIFWIPLLYVIPYFNTAVAMYGRYIIEKNRVATAPNNTQEFDTAKITRPPEPEEGLEQRLEFAPVPEEPEKPEKLPRQEPADPPVEVEIEEHRQEERFQFPQSRYRPGPLSTEGSLQEEGTDHDRRKAGPMERPDTDRREPTD